LKLPLLLTRAISARVMHGRTTVAKRTPAPPRLFDIWTTANGTVQRAVDAATGGSFIALKDAPGPCPGSGWQLLASQGKRGVAGEKGERGPQCTPGLSGATIRDWKIDRARYVATPVMSDGSEGPPLELRGLFEQFLHETR